MLNFLMLVMALLLLFQLPRGLRWLGRREMEWRRREYVSRETLERLKHH
jgi:hypothetical protein